MNNQIQVVLKSSTTEMSLNDHDSGIYIVPELNGLTGLPDIRTTSGVNAGYDGGWTSAQNYDARSITLRGVIANEDKATVERMRKQLVSLLGQGKNEELTLDIVTEAGSAYEIQVRTIACEMAMQRVLTQQEFMIQLRADDPLIYDNTEAGEPAIVQVQKALGGFQIPFEIPLAIGGGEDASVIDNHGLEQVAPIVKMYGALHNPKIINQTTNQYMQIEANIGYAEGAYTDAETSDSGQHISFDAPITAPLADFSLKGNTAQQTYSGKNLLDMSAFVKGRLDNGVVGYVDGTSVLTFGDNTLSYTTIANYRGITSDYCKVSASTGYIASWTDNTDQWAQVAYYDSSKTFIRQDNIPSATTTAGYCTFTTPNNAAYVRIYMFLANAGSATIHNFQLESGSSATSYEPYVGGVPAPNPSYPQPVQVVTGEQTVTISDGGSQSQSYEVNLGKNLFDASQDTTDYFINSSGAEVANTSWDISGYIPVVAGQTYSYHGLTNVGNAPYSAFYDASKTFVSSFKQAVGNNTITIPSGVAYVRFTIYHNDLDGVDNNQTFQLEKGSTATSYAAYFDPIELCKIGTYQDYIYKSGGDWYVHKETNKIVLTGAESENWSSGNMQNVVRYNKEVPDSITAQGTAWVVQPTYCASFRNISSGDNWNTAVGDSNYALVNATKIYRFTKGEAIGSGASTNSWRAWLASNPITLYYALATPTDTTITNDALIEQLDAILNSGRVYEGTNNITTVIAAGNSQGEVQVSYYTHQDPATRDEIIIDSRLRTITLNGLDIYDKKTEGSEFLMLAPGENKLILQSDIDGDNGYAEVNYKQGYLSI